jgi:hypothetical protein
MTALVGGTVERTFSAVGRYLTGLPGPKTHQAGRQDLGDFVEAVEFYGFLRLGEAHSEKKRRSPRVTRQLGSPEGCRVHNRCGA